MPSQGYTVSPVFTSGEAGEEQIVDFSISENRHGNNTDMRDFSVDESHGIVTNNYQDVELSEGGDGRLPDYDFRVAIHQTYPLLDQALTWASNGGLANEQVQLFDSVMTGDDPGAFYPAIEGLIAQFQQSGAKIQKPQSLPEPRQSQSPIPQEQAFEWDEWDDSDESDEFEEALSPIFSGQDEELVEDYVEQSEQQLQQGNHMGAMLSAGLAAFHQGLMTGDQVADHLIETFGEDAALEFLAEVLEDCPD